MTTIKYWVVFWSVWIAGICHAQQPALEKANDFVYIQANGEQGTLYALDAEILLLYFYDPTCEDCHRLMEQLDTSPVINRLIAEKRMSVLAVYPEEDMDLWTPYVKQVPSNWINGYDKGATINMKGLFSLTSLPALYLLDKEKHIILQTTAFDDIVRALEMN